MSQESVLVVLSSEMEWFCSGKGRVRMPKDFGHFQEAT
jgi:hypothetical protein